MTIAAAACVAGGWVYTYLAYPALLTWLSRRRPAPRQPADPEEWPFITIVLPVYNEAPVVAATLSEILSLDYPADRRQIVVVSDASTDDTDAIVGAFAARG